MNGYASAMAKLDSVSSYITNITDLLPIIPVNQRQLTKDFYAGLINSLRSAINYYKADLTNKESQARMLIMGCYQTAVMNGFTSSEISIQGLPNTGFPGYANISELYSCDGVYAIILAMNLSEFYNGPITQLPLPEIANLLPGEYILHDLTQKALKAEQSDSAKRLALHHWMSGVNLLNSFAIIFEGAIGSVDTNTQDAAHDIYINKGYLNIIREFNLNVYIPTYLREL